MKIGPKYKIARRLGAPVFEKTQTQKYMLSQSRKEKSKRFSRPKSEFGIQLLEKQKARYMYGLNEKQFARLAKGASAKKDTNTVDILFRALELRADNVAYRAGFAPTRLAARQMVSHGHLLVNGKRITIPSYLISQGDTLSVRAASLSKPLFANVAERMKEKERPAWLSVDQEAMSAKVEGMPKYDPAESLFDINAILEFYSR